MISREHTSGPTLEQLLNVGNDTAPLEQLLYWLEGESTRSRGIELLHELSAILATREQNPERLSLRVVDVPGTDRPIKLLVHPAVFTPENWGQTFAEGLLKNPEEFRSKRIVELGTGSGWISLVLLMRTEAQAVLGLDINPIAVICAKLNVWINGTASDGTLILSHAGIPIINAMRVAESDLLMEPLGRGETFDCVIGCIPQVLHPELAEPSLMDATSADLYDLSNYCFRQGILEDRFGLPLIARALEAAQLCLAPGGKVTLILGGRPGPDAIIGMFQRRGFFPELVWSRRIPQADDTDLDSLVKLERAHNIKFYFFVSRDSEQAISADTAVKLLAAGQPIFHDLLVYRARTNFERSTFSFVKNLRQMGLDSLRRELDFSRMTEEQISYLSRLSADMMKLKTIPYPHERGDMSLRRRLADFLQVYCHYTIEPERLFISAERAQLVSMILNLVTDRKSKVLLSESLEYAYRYVVEPNCSEIIEANDDLAEVFILDDLLNPDLLIITPAQLHNPSLITLEALATQAKKHPNRWYIIDDSVNFDISSDLNSNMMIRMLADYPLPSNVVLLYGLVKNTVQPDLELSFMLNTPPSWLEALDIGAELTYSRIAYPSQHYYEWLFDDLLSFTFKHDSTAASQNFDPSPSPLPLLTQQLADDPVFQPKPISLDESDLLRLDYGEFEHPVPDVLVKGLFKGFLEGSGPSLAPLIRSRISDYMKATRNSIVAADNVCLAQGVFPLFGALIGALKTRLGRPPRIAVPTGSYGPLYPLVKYHGGELIQFESLAAKGFVVDLESVKFTIKPDLIWLTQPSNPSGIFMDSTLVLKTLAYCADNGIYLLADEIFFLLSDVRMGAWTSPELSFGSHFGSAESKFLFVTDGIAKAFAAGGMRCGFMVCPDAAWATDIQKQVWLPPQSTMRAWDSLYSTFVDETSHSVVDMRQEHDAVAAYLNSARALLSAQRDTLLALLRKYNLDDGLDPANRGGIFLLGKLSEHFERLAREEHVLINPSDWARLSGWSRLCIGLPESKFNDAVNRLSQYLKRHIKVQQF